MTMTGTPGPPLPHQNCISIKGAGQELALPPLPCDALCPRPPHRILHEELQAQPLQAPVQVL